MKLTGTLVGHGADGKPIIDGSDGPGERAGSFDCIRLENTNSTVEPNWSELPAAGLIVRALPAEVEAFKSLLNQHTPPGPKYFELVTEMWARGFETFVVGGTVRDVIAGQDSKDVDLITTMPLSKLIHLVQGMYGWPRKIDEPAANNGHLRLGGRRGTSDPFIDLSVFKYYQVGSPNAVFGSSFERDLGHRDFACNSIYYDPMNEVLIDPSGYGISDAEDWLLRVVTNASLRRAKQLAQVVVRYFKFKCRGYAPGPECLEKIHEMAPTLGSMEDLQRAGYIRSQVMSRIAAGAYEEQFQLLAGAFEDADLKAEFDRWVDPLRTRIVSIG
jgi:hypothetical protein